MGQGRFGAVLCAMVTPFDGDGRLDLDGASALARWLVEQGNDGLVVTGTTGESPTLSDPEKLDLWKAVREAVTVPVIAGTSTPDTAHTVKMTKAAADIGVDGILAVTPYYNRPSQAGIEAHMRAVGAATKLPMLTYDIPVRSSRQIAVETTLRLARDGVIVGVKDATGNPARSAELLSRAPAGFELYSGNDGDTLPLLAIGASGVVSVEAHWAARPLGDMVEAYFKGDADLARTLNFRLCPSHRFQSSEDAPNPIPTKAMLRHLGKPAGQCRLPMGPAPEGLEQQAASVYDQLTAGV